MQLKTTLESHRFTIHLPESFNFSCQRAFRDAYEKKPASLTYIIDFSRVNVVDSATFGMLLLLREHAGEEDSKILISNCSQQVKQLFHVAKFDNFFQIN